MSYLLLSLVFSRAGPRRLRKQYNKEVTWADPNHLLKQVANTGR
jgi:hypothetical protein